MAQPDFALISTPPGTRQTTPELAKKAGTGLASGPEVPLKLAENIDQEIDFNATFQALLPSKSNTTRPASPPEATPKRSDIAIAGPRPLPSIDPHQIELSRPEMSYVDMPLDKPSHPQSIATLPRQMPVTATTQPEMTDPNGVSRRSLAPTAPRQSPAIATADIIDKIQPPEQKTLGQAPLSPLPAAATKTGQTNTKSARSNALPDAPIGIASTTPPTKPLVPKTKQAQFLPAAKVSLPKVGQKSPEVIPTPAALRQTHRQIDPDLNANSVVKIIALDSFVEPHPSAETGSIKLAPQGTLSALPLGLPLSGGQTAVLNTVSILPTPSPLALISIINPAASHLENSSFSISKNTGGIDLVIHSTEFGQIDIEFKLDETRAIRAIISTDLNRNLDFLRGHSAMLEHSLKESGFDSVDISFQSQENKQRENHHNAGKEGLTLDDPDQVALPLAVTTTLMINAQPDWWTSDHLDIKL